MTAGSVCSVRTISTSGMRGTGLKKCSPSTRDGSAVHAAMRATDYFDITKNDRMPLLARSPYFWRVAND